MTETVSTAPPHVAPPHAPETVAPALATRPGRWIDNWDPENEVQWETEGRAIARRNLRWSIFAEFLGFVVWQLWSIVAVTLPAAGFELGTGEIFWLISIPSLVGATLRIPYSFLVPKFGGRNWTIISAGLLLLPTIVLAVCVSNPETPFGVLLAAAALAGFGGGNFASSMSNITYFYPQKEKGWALGLNAAGGNLGASVAQFVVPIVITIGAAATLNLPLAGWIWIPFILLAMFGAARYMDNLSNAKADFAGSAAALKEPHLWIMSLLYIGTFGSFIGFASVFPKLIADQFPEFSTIGVGGASISPRVPRRPRRFARPPVRRQALRPVRRRAHHDGRLRRDGHDHPRRAPDAAGRELLAVPRAVPPAVRRRRASATARRTAWCPSCSRVRAAACTGDVSTQRKAAAALGLISAIGAYGGFLIPQALNLSFQATGGYAGAFLGFVVGICRAPRAHLRRVRALGPPPRPQDLNRDQMTRPAPTHCPYCALQCAMTLTPTDAADAATPPVTVAGRDFPTNRGGLCKKGWTSAELLRAPSRLGAPLVRGADGALHEASWDDALDLVATSLRGIRSAHGADAVGVFGGGGLTNEKAYLLGKFARLALGTSRIDYNGRYCMSSAAAAGNRAFGVDRGLPFPLEDLDGASTILLLGTNVAETMPPFIGHLAGAQAAGGLVVVDPRRTATARLTDDGKGLHVQPAPGTDLALLLGLIHIVIAERLVDADYVAERTVGFDRVRRSVASWWPERVQSVTGVAALTLRRLARRLASGEGTYILTGRGVEQHVDGTDTATAAINLALLLGLPGRQGSGYGTLTGQGNGQGGREHGQKCDQLPGYRKIVDPDARAHVARVWGVDPDVIPGPGVPAVELLQSLGRPGGVRALLVHGSNLVVSSPNVDAVREGIGRLDLLVVCDFFLSETAALADVVLPVTQWAEEEGTMTSLEGRVIRRRRAITPPDGVRDELWILAELARRLDCTASFDTDPELVFEELRLASEGGIADYSGIDYAMLDRGEAAYWPFPRGSAGTPRLFADRFAHPDGLARLVAVSVRETARPRPVDGELTLVTGPPARALPERRPDAGAYRSSPRRSPRRSPPCIPRPPNGSASPTATPWNSPTRAARCTAGHGSPPTSAPTTCSCRSTTATRRPRTC